LALGSLQSVFQLSDLWPPTVLTGIIVWAGFVLLSIFYLYYYKLKWKLKGNATIEFNIESFVFRTFAIAVSISVLIIQAAGVNLLAPLGAGGEQLYYILGLLASIGILVADLLRKLDSFIRATPKPVQPREPYPVGHAPQVPKLSYKITQTTSSGQKRQLPSVGFTVRNESVLPVKFRVFALVYLNDKSFGSPSSWSGHYNGKLTWNLNPGLALEDGNFTVPFEKVKKRDILMVVITVAILGKDGEETQLLPLSWVYMPEENDWYFEPAPFTE
jgi:hypothetical protein